MTPAQAMTAYTEAHKMEPGPEKTAKVLKTLKQLHSIAGTNPDAKLRQQGRNELGQK